MKIDKKLFNTLLHLIILVMLFGWLLVNISSVTGFVKGLVKIVSPFILGLCLAFVINIMMRLLEKNWNKLFPGKKHRTVAEKLRRPLCMVLSFLVVFGVVFAIIFLVCFCKQS